MGEFGLGRGNILLYDVAHDVTLLHDDVTGERFGSGWGNILLYDVVHDVTLLHDDVTGERCVPR